jgi:NitT/TauT family transport system substrate-binding protein
VTDDETPRDSGARPRITAAAGAAAQEPPLTKVRVGYDGFSMTSGPLNYATKKGLFKQFGLDVTPVWVEGGSTLTHAVVGGSIDIARNGYTPAAAAAVQGADIVFIGSIANKLPFQLVVKSSIASGQQLKGQAIAISRYGSSTDQAAEFALKQLGLARNDVRQRPEIRAPQSDLWVRWSSSSRDGIRRP